MNRYIGPDYPIVDSPVNYDRGKKAQTALAEKPEAALTPSHNKPEISYRGLCEIREIYCNMEGFIPETAPEGYILQEIKRMYDTAVEHIKLVDAGTPAAEPEGWRDISSAPRDGTCFLGFDPFLNCVFIGHMFKFLEGFKFVANEIVRDAQNWRPLPPPPTQPQAEDGR